MMASNVSSSANVREAMKRAKEAAGVRPRTEHAITRRRQEEDYLDSYKKLTQQNFKLKNLAEWEESTDQAIQRNQVRTIADKIKREQQQRLNHRRKKLRELLNSDAKAYKAELDALRESHTERRERLKLRAQEIRAAKEQQSRDFIEAQYRKQFRNSCDELRKNEGRNVMIECEKNRREQLNLKYLNNELQKKEEEKWTNLWEEERAKKILREEMELKERKMMNQKTFKEIDVQVSRLHKRRAELEAQKQQETMARVEQIRADQENAKLEQKRQQEEAARRRQEVTQFNQEFQARKEAERRQQEEEDRKIIENVLRKEAAEDHDDHEEKMRLSKDIKDYLAYRQAQREENAKLEIELDHLREIELKKAADKQDIAWNREDLARQKLMKEVYEHRELQILEKEMNKKREKQKTRLEREKLMNELDYLSSIGERERAKDLRNKQEMTRILKSQMEDNHYRREMDKVERFYERRASERAEQLYQEKLRREMEYDQANIGKNLKRHNLKSMNWFN